MKFHWKQGFKVLPVILIFLSILAFALDVKITSPKNGSYVSSEFLVNVLASDQKGIKLVELYVNDFKISEKSNEPYDFQIPVNVGQLKWKLQIGNYIASSPSLTADGTIYIASKDTNLYAISSDGKIKWKFKTGAEVLSSPAVGPDGTVYIGSSDTYL
ncbi:Ig-like domain-containing protein, partial [Fervidobacterium sp.]